MASASLLSWLWFAFVSFVRSSGVYSVLIHTLRTFSAKHQCHTSHSGSLQQYQCSSGPWNIMLDHAISQYEICNINIIQCRAIWNHDHFMKRTYIFSFGDSSPAYRILWNPFTSLNCMRDVIWEKAPLARGKHLKKCSSEENSVLLTQSEFLDWFPDFLIVHFCFQPIQSIRQ